jgi:hypothetical protein
VNGHKIAEFYLIKAHRVGLMIKRWSHLLIAFGSFVPKKCANCRSCWSRTTVRRPSGCGVLFRDGLALIVY